jgi:putative transcriptional regulator
MNEHDFAGLVEGLDEAVRFAKGEDVPGIRVHIPAEIDVKAIRTKLGMTQGQFAERHGFSMGAVRDWEQGRKMPDTSTRAFLKIIAAEPGVVGRVLEAI